MKQVIWGNDPEFWGPRDWFRNTLLLRELRTRKSEGRILDFGCGTGNLLLRLAKLGYKCVGIDNSKLSVNYTKKLLKKMDFGREISIFYGSEKKLSEFKKCFDVIFAGEVLEHLNNDNLVVKSFYECLKIGGICIVSVPARKRYWDYSDELAGHVRRYEMEDLGNLFETNGFKILKIYFWGFPLTYFWHKMFYSLFLKTSIVESEAFTGSKSLRGKLLKSLLLKKLLSGLFWFDQLFNWTNLGSGLILVAEK